MSVTLEQRDLAIKLADSLTTVLRDGTVNLLMGRAQAEEATPILDRIKELLEAAGRDTDAILDDALTIAAAEGLR